MASCARRSPYLSVVDAIAKSNCRSRCSRRNGQTHPGSRAGICVNNTSFSGNSTNAGVVNTSTGSLSPTTVTPAQVVVGAGAGLPATEDAGPAP